MSSRPTIRKICATLAILTVLHSIASGNEVPNFVKMRRDITVDIEIQGTKTGKITLKKGEMLAVVGESPDGYFVKKGNIGPINLKRHLVEQPLTAAQTQSVKLKPFYEKYWRNKGVGRNLYPWLGKNIVLLTLTQDLDPQTISEFVEYLDVGWEYYSEIVGKTPSLSNLSKEFDGRATVIAAKDPSFLGGSAGLGLLGITGIEVAFFYEGPGKSRGDYEKFKKEKIFPAYYYYEMGRNFYLFKDSHSVFTTGFAVAMSILCLDHIEQKSKASGRTLAKQPRQTQARLIEALFHESQFTWQEGFSELGGSGIKLIDEQGTRLPSGLADIYAGIVLYLYDNCGKDDWLKKFYGSLLKYPPSPRSNPEGFEGQLLLTLIAASSAAEKNLVPLFRDRWRIPLKPNLYHEIEKINWTEPHAEFAWMKIPPDLLPRALAHWSPEWGKSRQQKNLLKNHSFENGTAFWSSSTLRLSRRDYIELTGQHGRQSLKISGDTSPNYVIQSVRVQKNRKYFLSGWINPRNLQPLQQDGGAKLRAENVQSQMFLNGEDWFYAGVLIESSSNSLDIHLSVENCLGYAFFDNLSLFEVPDLK